MKVLGERIGGHWFTAPRLWTLAFSVVAVALGLSPGFSGGAYDPGLAVLTATLIAILWYTCFTYESVELSRRLAYRAEEAATSTLSIRAQRILDQLEQLPQLGDEQRVDPRIRGTTVWRDGDLEELEKLAAYLGPGTADRVSQVVVRLRWMGERIADVRRVDSAHGYVWQGFPWDQWTELKEAAEEELRRLLS